MVPINPFAGAAGAVFQDNSIATPVFYVAAGRGYNSPMDISLTELEEAINYWRAVRPSSGEERALSPEVNALATVYALMIFNRAKAIPLDTFNQASRQLLESWRAQR